jgi:ComF family protein
MLREFFRLFYPRLCAGCGDTLKSNEADICLNCRLNLPETYYGFDEKNPIARVFWGRLPITAATSLLFFQKQSVVQKLMHELKYNGNKYVGVELGKMLGNKIKLESEVLPDVLVPVPLHPKRLRKRGYNQSDMIADGIHQATGIPIDKTSVVRSVFSNTQTRKGRESRWENVSSIFSLSQRHDLNNKYVLIVDDVLTTGATIEACGQEILKADNVRLGVATIACA